MTSRPLAIPNNVTLTRVTGTPYVNGPHIREVTVSLAIGAFQGDTVTQANYTTTYGGVPLSNVLFANVINKATPPVTTSSVKVMQTVTFKVDAGATYRVDTVLGTPTGGTVAVASWVETDIG